MTAVTDGRFGGVRGVRPLPKPSLSRLGKPTPRLKHPGPGYSFREQRSIQPDSPRVSFGSEKAMQLIKPHRSVQFTFRRIYLTVNKARELRFLQTNECLLAQINSRSGSATSLVTPVLGGAPVNGKGPTEGELWGLEMQKSVYMLVGTRCLDKLAIRRPDSPPRGRFPG
jgi:hypothetical protein